MNLKNANSTILSLLVLFVVSESCLAKPKQANLWEKVEIELQSEKDYPNPYTDVDVWVNLKGPGFDKRCYGFWDGGRTWRIRVMATNTGQWTWESGSNQVDTGLNNKTGAFVATDWTEAEKVENPLRRGMIKADAKGHSFEYADGTPMFWLADTWWSCMTKRYFWYEDDTPRKVGTPKAGFKDYVHYRKKQGYNGCMVIAAFPNWLTDKHGWTGGNWEDEKGNWSFVVEGNEPDLDRLNPKYFQSMDKKVDYLNAHGFIPFIETSRRDIAEYWKANYQWPDSYARYIRYICFRYQGHIIINSPIHLDNWKYGLSKEDWNQAANTLMDNYDWPPFGHMASANPPGSTLKAFGHTDEARWLSFHGVGNTSRDHFLFRFVPEIFHLANPVPVVVNEPYYDGLQWGNKAEQGSDLAAYYSRVALYGSVLSGALAGHVYGAHHIWRGDEQMPEAFVIQSAAQMQHIRGFLFSEGDAYRNLVEARDLLQPHETPNDDKNMGWSYCMKNAAKDLFLLYFEAGCQKARLSGVQPEKEYKLDWFDPRDGKWVKSQNVTSDKNGSLVLPEFPGNESVSKADWALKLKLAEGTSQKPVLGADDNLMAWAFLAFDPEGRSADERAQMLKGLKTEKDMNTELKNIDINPNQQSHADLKNNEIVEEVVKIIDTSKLSQKNRTEMPQSIYDINRRTVSPRNNSVTTSNPPRFLWPIYKESRSRYKVEICRANDFISDTVIKSEEKQQCFYIHHKKLDIGKWYWRYQSNLKGKLAWSPVYSFDITKDTPVFETATVEELIENLPKSRPYIMTMGETQAHVKKNCEMFPELRQSVIERGDKVVKQKMFDMLTEDKSKHTPREFYRLASKDVEKLPDLCSAYLVTGNKKYYKAAESRLVKLLEWPELDGMADADLNRVYAIAYDTFYSLLPANFKNKILEKTNLHLKKNYQHWAGRVSERQINNHFWQKELSGFFMTALATVQDFPENRRYLEFAYEVFLARSPVVGGNDGGWANGLPYFGVNSSTVAEMAFMLHKIAKVDVFSSLWYKNMASYFIHCAPVGGPMDGFGDMHDRGTHWTYGEKLCLYLGIAKNDQKALFRLAQLGNDNPEPWFRLVNGRSMPSLKSSYNPKSISQSRLFKEVGLVTMHTDILNNSNNLGLFFRSSPYGATGHMHANQNCFNLSYIGETVFYSSGYYTSFADPHTVTSYKHTRAHNGILINGRGQAFGHEGYGWIKRYAHGKKISYVCGDASQAYKKVIDEQWSELIDKSLNNDNALSRSEHFGDAKLKKFDRHVIMLRPNIVVIYDELESEIPCDWDLLMHTDKESNKESENRFAYKTPKFSASAHVYASQKIEFTVSNQFGAKPVDFQKKYKAIPDQYHASFKSVSKSKKMRYLSILQCRDNTNELQLIDDNNNGVFEVNDWKIVVDLESNEFSGMKIIGKDSSLFVNHLPESIYGKKVKMPSREASLLIERSGGNISMSIVENLLPAVSN